MKLIRYAHLVIAIPVLSLAFMGKPVPPILLFLAIVEPIRGVVDQVLSHLKGQDDVTTKITKLEAAIEEHKVLINSLLSSNSMRDL